MSKRCAGAADTVATTGAIGADQKKTTELVAEQHNGMDVNRVITTSSSLIDNRGGNASSINRECLMMLEVQLAQLALHKGQVCTCEQVEV